jgi:hypothetical protein
MARWVWESSSWGLDATAAVSPAVYEWPEHVIRQKDYWFLVLMA